MEYRKLGQTDDMVSALCLGTMTFGEQNTEQEAFALLDQALDFGVNFLDMAEMYPVPPRAETMGRTEVIVGKWLADRRRRDRLVIATKVSGPGKDWLPYIRGGGNRLDRKNIMAAAEASLQRLQTDVIDLYQLHWPDRETNYFGQLGYRPATERATTPLQDTLEALSELVQAGKVRHVGVSNETPWGLMECLRLADQYHLPRVVSIQNPYNLLNRSFEIGLAEIAHRERVGLLAYSPLGFGTLSGKYLDGARPAGARLTRFDSYTRYSNEQAVAATIAYVETARRFDLDPAQMALAFVISRPFLTSCIIGATQSVQLAANLKSSDIHLHDAVIEALEAIHNRHPNPSP